MNDYEFLLSYRLIRNVTEQYEDLHIYYNIKEKNYLIYDSDNKLMDKIVFSVAYIFPDYFSDMIEEKTKEFIRDKKLEKLLDE